MYIEYILIFYIMQAFFIKKINILKTCFLNWILCIRVWYLCCEELCFCWLFVDEKSIKTLFFMRHLLGFGYLNPSEFCWKRSENRLKMSEFRFTNPCGIRVSDNSASEIFFQTKKWFFGGCFNLQFLLILLQKLTRGGLLFQ